MRSKNYLEVYSYIQASFIFHVSFLYDFWHSPMFGLCWPFWGLLGIFLGFGEVRKLFWGLIINILEIQLFEDSFYFDFYFDLILELSGLFWVKKGIFGVSVRFKNCSGVYSWILTTFALYVWLSSNAIVQFHFFLRRDGRRDGQTYL